MTTTLLSEGFEHGPDGSDIGDGETAFSFVEGRYDNDQVHTGALAFLNGIIEGAPALSGGTFLFPSPVTNITISGWVYADGLDGMDTVNGGAWAFEVGSGVRDDGTSDGLIIGQYLRELLPDIGDDVIDPGADANVFVIAQHVAADEAVTYDFITHGFGPTSDEGTTRWGQNGWQQFTMIWTGDDSWTITLGSADPFDSTGDVDFVPVGFQFYAQSLSDDGLSLSNWMDDFLITTEVAAIIGHVGDIRQSFLRGR